MQTARETTQPNLADLEYWATGLTPIYLEGALNRALDEPPVILDPFSFYAKGEPLLSEHLRGLGTRHLRGMIRAYDLADAAVDLDVLDEEHLIALILAGVRARAHR